MDGVINLTNELKQEFDAIVTRFKRTADLTERRILIAEASLLIERLRELQTTFDEDRKIHKWTALRHSRVGTKSNKRKLLAKAPKIAPQTGEHIGQFVLIELEMATTFCKRALCTDDPMTRTRNIENALKGYETALWHLSKYQLPIDEVAFQQKREEVKSLLQQLGREV